MDTNSLVGLQRMLVLRDKVDLLLLGNVPSPLPRWADKVFFCSIKRITTGQNSGDVLVTVGTKGTDITAFSLDINNSMPYADLDDIMETQLGQWVLGSVVIEVSELEVPMMEGVWTTNTLVIDWSSDVSGAVTESHVIDLVFNP
ncbi:MAG: hypothetical protein CMJ89_07475 [Planctomycetes bacterium]|jgi:hypothetical protein|nr:hypothetical protein [Planctomycetota bacterium]